MGQPKPMKLVNLYFIEKQTWGTETSQYPEEEKTIVIPSVVASESGTAQTIAVTAAMGL